MSQAPSTIDWKQVQELVVSRIDEIRPATYDEMMSVIGETHEDAPLGVLEQAVDQGVLNKHGDGLDDAYSFDPSFLGEDENVRLDQGDRSYAPTMVNRDQWIVYEEGSKDVKAPWKTGNLYRAKWGMQLDEEEYPETDFETAQRWSDKVDDFDLPGSEECGNLHPGFLLQREVGPSETNIVMIDLDDVRDPETGYIIPEAQDIIDRAGSYAEVSMSGAGVHVFVFGHLPETYPKHRLIEELNTNEKPAEDDPKVEIYHRRRVCITTGNHIESTPEDVQDGHELIADLCDEYFDDDRSAEDVLDDLKSRDDSESDYSSGERSPYFDVDPASLVNSSSYRVVGNRVQGPHPEHGSSGGSTFSDGGKNFAIEGGVWTCYRHGTGGNALHLVAVLEGYLSCEDSGRGCLGELSDTVYARLCLDARDHHGFEGKPPYRALLGLAKARGLAAESSDEFDGGLYDLLREMYDGAESTMV